MKDQTERESVRRAVEILAGAIEIPPPPGDLRMIVNRSGPHQRLYAVAASLLAATLIAGWLLWDGVKPINESPGAGVVIEHLRIGGRPAPVRIVTPPGAGAVVVITNEQELNGIRLGVEERKEAVIARGTAPAKKENLR